MGYIKWTNAFSVQNKEIDDQHKNWIDIYNKAHGWMIGDIEKDNRSDIGRDALNEMLEYCRYHFSFEEKFMAETGFSGIEPHKVIHEDFVKKIDHIYGQIDQGIMVLNSEVIKIIENWIVDHILNEDKKYMVDQGDGNR